MNGLKMPRSKTVTVNRTGSDAGSGLKMVPGLLDYRQITLDDAHSSSSLDLPLAATPQPCYFGRNQPTILSRVVFQRYNILEQSLNKSLNKSALRRGHIPGEAHRPRS